MPELAISTEKVGFLIEKARQFDVKDISTDLESGSNAVDDGMAGVLEESDDDSVVQEIADFISGLSDDERIDLVALMRLGRGDGTAEEWDDLRKEAIEGDNRRTAHYLLGEPLLGDMLAEGLEALGRQMPEYRTVLDQSGTS
jgi:hypothetical protein